MSESSASKPLYESLDPSQQQIRILKIMSVSSTDEPIVCELRVATLDAAVKEHQFSALSYVWGDEKNTRRIRVNGHVMDVTVHLEDALRQFRDGPPEDLMKPTRWSGWLWADAICINQVNKDEKSHQVRLMGEIFRRATRVLSWLGTSRKHPSYFNSKVSVGRPNSFFKHGSISKGMRLLKRITSELLPSSDISPLHLLLKHADLWLPDTKAVLSSTWIGLISFTQTEYWKRLWIVQEVILADPSGHIIIWGQSSVNRSKLIDFDTWFEEANFMSIPQPDEITSAIWAMIQQLDGLLRKNIRPFFPEKNSRLQGIKMPLFMALQNLRCRDPRDVVYALMNVANIDITIDYNKKPSDIYVEYTTIICSYLRVENYYIASLSLSGIGLADTDECKGLPSWTPNFHIIWKTTQVVVMGLTMEKGLICE